MAGTATLQCSSSRPADCLLPRSLEAPAHARRFVHDVLCREHGSDALEAAELVASELVTHAVLYGHPPFEIAVECRLWDLRLTVSDGRAEEPELTDPSDELRVMLLRKVTRNSGTTVTATGKSRWYDIPTGLVPWTGPPAWRGGGW
jgi:hypothetical protein